MEQVDRDILNWIATHTGDTALAEQIAVAEVQRRDHTRTGFFVYFAAIDGVTPVAAGVRPVTPRIEAAGLVDGAGCDLFLRAGQLHYLEVYARGGFLPEPFNEYQLVADT